ncbi:MAG: NADP(H)-dependent aldo-keto reductase [Alphaproteobacteria bacterium]
MDYRKLGKTDLEVSAICLGTMTFGKQNTEADAHAQLDYALANGVNFIDTAEMYPVPPEAETQGSTETYIGTWFAVRKNRDKVVLATKVTGPSRGFTWIREGENRLTRAHITEAIEGNLRRLQTDYVDLYQLHWPDRSANFFGQLGYTHQTEEEMTPLLETLEVLGELVKQGKIRNIGLSNETPWGTMKFLELAKTHTLPRAVSVQNPYNLLNRVYEVGMAEVSCREECGLLAYSPLAFGMLSGKYLDNQWPENGRLTLFDRFKRYMNNEAYKATEQYVAIAKRHGLDPAQMALSFVNDRPFVSSNIIGATTMDQLKSNIASIDLKLSEDVLEEIETVHQAITNPCP